MNPTKSAIAIVGNPGTGKSTILNGLIGEPVFKSGISMGTGMTTHLQGHIVGDTTYYDTPGLNDVEKRKEAGVELDKLLEAKVSLKIIFVVTVQNGRVTPEDAATISLVLDAITSVETNDRFGVIINQASLAFIKNMTEDPRVEAMVRSQITGSRHTSFWEYIPFDLNFVDAKDQGLISPAIVRLLNKVPETRPSGAIVSQIDTASFADKLAKEVEAFSKKEEALKKELERQRQRVKSQAKAVERMGRKVAEGTEKMGQMEEEAARQYARLERKVDQGEARVQKANRAASEMMEQLASERRRAQTRDTQARRHVDELRQELRRVMDRNGQRVVRSRNRAIASPDSGSEEDVDIRPTVVTRRVAPTGQGSDTIYAGQSLSHGQSLVCKTGRFRLTHQGDGNIVIYDTQGRGKRAIWASGTDSRTTTALILKRCGDFAALNGRTTVWSTGTSGKGTKHAVMQNDGNFVLYSAGGPVWSSNSWQHGWSN